MLLGMGYILIVEDDDFMAKALQDSLNLESFKTYVADNGKDATSKIKKNKPTLVLLDLLLSKKDGFEVLSELKDNPDTKLIPVIVLSNLGGDEDIKRALQLGADDYFVKAQHPLAEIVEKAKQYMEGGIRASMNVRA